jgi:prefoldin alpha subunit
MEKRTDREKLQVLLAQMGGYQELSQALRQQIVTLTTARSELLVTRDFLKNFQQIKPETDILVPIGAGAMIKGKVGAVDKVLVDLGAGVAVERTPPEAVEALDNRLKEVDETIRRIQDDIARLEERIETMRPKAEELAKRLEKGLRET